VTRYDGVSHAIIQEFDVDATGYTVDQFHQYQTLYSIEDEIHDKIDVNDETLPHRYPPGRCFQRRVELDNLQLSRNYTNTAYGPIDITVNGNQPRVSCPEYIQLYLYKGSTSSTASGLLAGTLYPVLPNANRNLLSEEAFNYFADVFPEEFSFSEFAQGLFELQALLPTFQETITRTISGGYLNWKFGWENLLSDLGSLGQLFQSVQDRMEYFKRTYGIPTRLGFSRKDVWEPNYSSYTLDYNVAGHTWWSYRIALTKFKCDYRATAWVTQYLDYVDGFAGFIRTMIGALGLDNPVKAVWKIMPMSFVVDWFFNVSQHLDNLTQLSPATGWNVRNVTHSVKYELEYEITQLGETDSSQARTPSIIKVSRYDREVGLSFDLELLNPDELSDSQLTLLLAMLHQLG
jgi:hypothetical protein